MIVFGSEAQKDLLQSVCNELGFKFYVRPTDSESLKRIILDRDDKENNDVNDVRRTTSAVTITPTERSDA